LLIDPQDVEGLNRSTQTNKGRHKMTYRDAFPDYDPASMPAVPTSWADISWHSDTCPSFTTGNGLLVYVEYTDDDLRELGGQRFMVMVDPAVADSNDILLETDDWNAVLSLVSRYRPS
jgi:hypothetical protein